MSTQQDTQGGNPHPTPLLKKPKTTSGRFRNSVKGLAKSKPKGGAPFGNRNALKTGRYTRQMRAFRREIQMILADSKALLAELQRGSER